jgi:hypothetical protein
MALVLYVTRQTNDILKLNRIIDEFQLPPGEIGFTILGLVNKERNMNGFSSSS